MSGRPDFDHRLEQAAAEREAGAFGAARRHLNALLRVTSRGSIQQAAVLNHLGILGKATGQFAEARRHYLSALPIVRRHPRNPYLELADLYHNLGGLDHARGRYRAGEPLARKAIALRARRHGPQAIVTWLDRTAHAALLHGLGDYARAERVYRRALPRFRRHYGAAHFEVAMTRNNLGCALALQGKWPEARREIETAVRLFTRLLGPRHPTTRATRRTLAAAEAAAQPCRHTGSGRHPHRFTR
ncbi:MAG TPA: tetratricopeptide repeat protein [Gemmatimonadales bacterium]|nr:tetratricopeptide repeat protein [Gemmatimonadales bacterium]